METSVKLQESFDFSALVPNIDPSAVNADTACQKEESGEHGGENSPMRVCFVCTGNTCRSPMAEAAASFYYPPTPDGCGIIAESCGLMPGGSPISKNALTALENAGIEPREPRPYTAHVSRQASEDILSRCDIIVTMTSSHAMALMSAFPSLAGRITVMPREISDPFGGSEADYAACLGEIIAALRELFPGGHF